MKKIIFIVSCLLIWLTSFTAWADFDIEVTPEDMSRRINLSSQGAVSIGEDRTFTVTVKITSDVGEKYEVKQKMIEPLQNEKGVGLNQDAVVFHTLPTNTSGSLYADGTPIALDVLEQTLYSSSNAGDSDQFIIAYSVVGSQPGRINAAGEFRGSIRYYVVPRGGAGTEDEEIFNVYLNVKETELKTEIITSSSSTRTLELSTDREEEMKGNVKIELEGMDNENYDVVQIVKENFKDEKGKIISFDNVNFFLSAREGLVNYSAFSPLERELVIYSSQGRASIDELTINFAIDDATMGDFDKGEYEGALEYRVKREGQIKATIPLDIKIEVAPVFEIEVISEDGAGGRLFFRNLKDKDSYMKKFEEKEVTIKVKTNFRKPYSVIQKLEMPFTNKEGDTIPLELLSLRQEIDKRQNGQILVPNDEPLTLGDMKVFLSDAQGSPSQFKVVYSLKIAPEIRSGDYFTNLSYSLVEK
ncbi:MAG: hypothetical protein ABIH71_05815 [Candidatus Omnitrophota bacterium]